MCLLVCVALAVIKHHDPELLVEEERLFQLYTPLSQEAKADTV